MRLNTEQKKRTDFMIRLLVFVLAAVFTYAMILNRLLGWKNLAKARFFFILCTVILGGMILWVLYLCYKQMIAKESSEVSMEPNREFIHALTDLENWNYLEQFFETMIQKKTQQNYAYALMDIENFKFVNNTIGYEGGNKLLRHIARSLRSQMGEEEVAIHVNADIFGIMILYETKEELEKRLSDMFRKIKKEVMMQYADQFHLVFSCGVYLLKEGETQLQKIQDCANIARKSIKGYFHIHTAFYQEEMQEVFLEQKIIEEEVEKALRHGEFQVYFQPKVNMISSKICGAEALIRWNHPKEGLRPPDKFVPVLERSGFIVDVDMFVFEEVCRLRKKWKKEIESVPLISINMSRIHLYYEDFVPRLVEIAKKYNINPGELEIEITENAFFDDAEEMLEKVRQLKEAGFILSIDDFGSGYSSLNMLKDIPADVIKIDRMFLKNSSDDTRSKTIIKSIIYMAKNLRLSVITEGVETKEQVGFLTRSGCEIAQGFYYARPMPLDEYEKFMKEHSHGKDRDVYYEFDGVLTDIHGENPAEMQGGKVTFTEGVEPGKQAVYFPGGNVGENQLMISPHILQSESYTVAAWLKEEVPFGWTSAIYVEYENGFWSVVPFAWEGHSAYRIKDGSDFEGYYDCFSYEFKTDAWYHVAVTYNEKSGVSRFYLNGECVAEKANVPILHNIKQIRLGGDIYQRSFKGAMDKVYFSNEVKEPIDIYEMYAKYKNAVSGIGLERVEKVLD